jgi:hypothetical protein
MLSPTPTPGSSGSDAPFYNNSNSSPTPSQGVPTYSDPNEVNFQPPRSNQADHTAIGEFGSVEGTSGTTASVAKPDADSAEFLAPVTSLQTATTLSQTPSGVFAYDAEGYRWLRGIAQFNESTGNWSLLYSSQPADGDQFHGWVTLADHPQLSQLTPNGAFLIKGLPDLLETDGRGKPLYRVESIAPADAAP